MGQFEKVIYKHSDPGYDDIRMGFMFSIFSTSKFHGLDHLL